MLNGGFRVVVVVVRVDRICGIHVGMPAGLVVFRDIVVDERFYVVLSHVDVLLSDNGTCE